MYAYTDIRNWKRRCKT